MTLERLAERKTYGIIGNPGETFFFPFKFFDTADLVVIQVDATTNAKTLKLENTDYTVDGADDPDGGTITWIGTPTAGDTLEVERYVEMKQETDLPVNGPMPADQVERMSDRITAMVQQLAIRLGGTKFGDILTEFLGLSTSFTDRWDAKSRRVINGADPVDATDLVTKQWAEGLATGGGNLPAPGAAGRGLKGTGASTSAWADGVLVPAPAAGDIGKPLVAVLEGEVPNNTGYVTLNAPQVLINGSFDVWQRGTSFTQASSWKNNDETYGADRWLMLSDGDDVVDVDRVTDAPDGARYAWHASVQSANKKFGLMQIIEAADTPHATKGANGVVSLSFDVKASAGLNNVRATVLAWTGAADSPTRDWVDTWGAAGSDPTPVASWTVEVAGSNIGLTTDYVRHTIDGIDLDTVGTTNLAVFIWLDDDDAQIGDELWVGDVKLENNSIATPLFDRKRFREELADCMRTFQKTFPYTVEPVAGSGDLTGSIQISQNGAVTIGIECAHYVYPVPMSVAPAVTRYNPSAGQINTKWGASGGPASDRTSAVVNRSQHASTFVSSQQFAASNGYFLHATFEVVTL